MKPWRRLFVLACIFMVPCVYGQNPIAEYRMDTCNWQGNAGEVVDFTGNGYDGTAMGGLETGEGFLCQSANFNDPAKYIQVSNNNFNFTDSVAMMAWVKWTIDPATGNPGAVIAAVASPTDPSLGQFWLGHDNTNTHFQFTVRVGGTLRSVTSGTTVQANRWYHLTGVYNGSRLFIFVDAGEDGRINLTGNVESYQSSFQFQIGRSPHPDNNHRSFTGQVDEAKVFNVQIGRQHIQPIENQEGRGNNWDGSDRYCALCGLTVHYRMDECEWNSTPDEVVDSSGNAYHGTAFNSASTVSGGVICNAGSFNRSSSFDYAVLDNRAIDGAGDFTFMTWFRTPERWSQGIISGASSSSANSWLLFQDRRNRFRTYIYNNTETYDLPYNINDDRWHHVAWVREGGTEYLYLDGVLVDSNSRTTATIYVDNGGLIIGQEQDCVGGCFDSSQAFIGELDELMIFDRALDGDRIEEIHDLLSSGVDLDGTTRACPACDPLVDFHMDECSWNGTSGEVIDSTGNGYDGTATGGAVTGDTDPLLCRYGDLTGTGYVRMPSTVPLPSTWTMTTWVKFPLDATDHTAVGSYGNVYVLASVSGTGDLGLLYDSGGTDIRWGVYDNGGGFQSADFPDGLSGWHHITLLAKNNGKTEIFLDGTSLGDVNTFTTGSLQYVGTSSDDPTGQTVGAHMDEFKVFPGNLSSDQINNILGYEAAGLDWSGGSRACADCSPIAEYRMDDCVWEGLAGEVLDTSGNGYDGVATDAGTIEAGLLCRAGEFNSSGATGQYVTLPTAVTHDLQDFSFNTWVKPEDTGAHTLVSAASSSNPNTLLLFIQHNTQIDTYVNRSGYPPNNSYSVPDLADGAWHMVTWTRRGDTESLYVDGSFIGSNITDNQPLTVNSLILGQEQDCVGGCFVDNEALRGQQDEVTFWNRALNSSEIGSIYTNLAAGNNWDGTVRNCNSCVLVSYYETQHDGSAICCYPERVHLVVRDASGGVVTGFTGTVQLSTSTANGTWYTAYPSLTSDDPAQGTLSDPVDDDGAASYTFTAGDQGEVSLFLRNLHAESLTITVTDGTFTNAGHNGGPLTFSPQGFVIKDGTGNDIPNQISGYPFTVTVRAVGLDPATGECNLLDYNGTRTLSAMLFYDTPASGTTDLVLAGQPVSATGSTINLDFTGSLATVTARYDDAGRIFFRLTDPDMGFSGDSNLFVVKPWAYAVWANGNPAAVDASGGAFVPAGDPFTLNVSAVCWNAGDDTDGDLVPDTGADLTDNTVTGNYAANVSVTHSLVLPSGGQTGTLTGIPVSITNGTASSPTAMFSEVGIIDINVVTADYLTAGSVSGSSGNVGRFTPKYLETTLSQIAACSGIFTYADQPFNLTGSITALNTTGGTTQNYTGNFAKLTAGDLTVSVNTGTGTLSPTAFALTFNSGLCNYTMNGWQYGWGAPHDPENVILQLTGSDSDSVPCYNASGTSPVLSNSVNYRYGRLQVMDAYGPSDRELSVPIQASYYSGGDYVLNTDDSCTTYVLGDFTLSSWAGNLNSGETAAVSVTAITGGEGSILLSPPGLGNEGTVMITPSAPAWFQFDAGISTFGIYRGDDRVISWEEIQK